MLQDCKLGDRSLLQTSYRSASPDRNREREPPGNRQARILEKHPK
jgi:hypothetical protein